MNEEEIKLSIEYLEKMKDEYVEGYGYEAHPLPEYFAIEYAIKALTTLKDIRAEIEEYKNRQLVIGVGIADLEKGKQIALNNVLTIIDCHVGG